MILKQEEPPPQLLLLQTPSFRIAYKKLFKQIEMTEFAQIFVSIPILWDGIENILM